jgi:pyruvate/oxaloacetate carboxyltransferase
MKISDLTKKIVAYNVIPDINMDEVVDWAIEMLQLGYETPHLLILSGLSNPINNFEAISYLKKTLQELHLEEKTGEAGAISLCSYYIQKIADGEHIRENLALLYRYQSTFDYDHLISDFFNLYWAWQDLDEEGNQYYWPDADADNIEDIVIKTAKDWISNI